MDLGTSNGPAKQTVLKTSSNAQLDAKKALGPIAHTKKTSNRCHQAVVMAGHLMFVAENRHVNFILLIGEDT